MSRTKTAGYIRVSTSQQAEQGVSLDAQRAKIVAYAELYDLDLVEVVVDAGVGAKTLSRPGLGRALAMLKSGGAEALLVVKLDRLTRSVRDLGELVEKHFAPGGAALLSVGEQIDTRSAGGRLVMNVLVSVSQWEREAIGERTSAAMRHMAACGRYTGGFARFGFIAGDDGTLMPVESEQRVIAEARRLRGTGASLQAIANTLGALGFASRTGRAFAPVQVRRMLPP